MPGTRNSYLAFFIPTFCSVSSVDGICPGCLFRGSLFVTAPFNILRHQFVLIEQVDRLLDEGGLTVFQMQAEFMKSLGVTIADPALQSAVGFLLAFHMLALALGVVLCLRVLGYFLIFLAHMTVLFSINAVVISHYEFFFEEVPYSLTGSGKGKRTTKQ